MGRTAGVRRATGPGQGHDQVVGRRGEQLAADYLELLGWRILDRNWRCPAGELDLVALEPGDGGRDCLVFVEVKCRTGSGFGDPLEAITVAKVAKLVELSRLWLRSHDMRAPHVRIDGVGVLAVRGRRPEISHARGITQ